MSPQPPVGCNLQITDRPLCFIFTNDLMLKNSVKIFAPATVSNVGPGFDLMGFAMENPGDILTIRRNKIKEFQIINNTEFDIPLDLQKNVSAVAGRALLEELNINEGFDIIFHQKIRPGSGIGSSAASCTAAVYGINALLGSPLTPRELIPSAMKGEFLASGSIHADNIAPAMLGGFVLIRDYSLLDIIRLAVPPALICVVVHPEIEIKTSESRKHIPVELPTSTALKQCGNIAGLVTGINTSDYGLIGRSLHDFIAEPVRAPFIEGYEKLKEDVVKAGAIGANISGSGPSVFAFCTDEKTAERISSIMADSFDKIQIPNKVYVSKICGLGTRILK